ncbi:MAG: deoxynucleoside kinase [Clostridia bacterium]|nr:deoxynucleoside kinase [Clostridia bacterium]
MSGKIIVIEGTDGSGKKTQTELLFKYLNAKSETLLQSFPNYESNSAAPIKMYLNGEFGETANSLDAYSSSLLFTVDRICTWQKLKKDYENGKNIVFDRYVQSNMIHQACKIEDEKERDKFLNWIDNLEFDIVKLPRPNKVFFLNMPPNISKSLANARKDLKAGTKQDIHEKDEKYLISAYNAGMSVAKKFGWEIIECVDNGRLKTIEEIHKEIVSKL